MNWYEGFSKDYMLIYPHRDSAEAIEQINFLLKTIPLRRNAKILDLCCGAGRHSIELIKRGYDVISADLSIDLLTVAKNNGLIKIVRCDMRHIPFVNQFDLVIQFFTSFGYFQTDDQNQKVLESIALALKSDGKFLIDYMNPDYVINNLVDRDEKHIWQNIHLIQERWISGQRINKKITMIKDGIEKNYWESVRMYSRQEMENMINKAGLYIWEIYGDFSGTIFNIRSPRMIIIGQKCVS